MTEQPQTGTFEAALKARAAAMADACTRCGKCVEVCPATEAAGLTAGELESSVRVLDRCLVPARPRAVGAAGPGSQQCRQRRKTRNPLLPRLQRNHSTAQRGVGARNHGFDM